MSINVVVILGQGREILEVCLNSMCLGYKVKVGQQRGGYGVGERGKDVIGVKGEFLGFYEVL